MDLRQVRELSSSKVFIVIQDGIPQVARELAPLRPNRLAAMKKCWERCNAFDANFRYEARPAHEIRLTSLQRFLARTIYNAPLGIEIGWEKTRPCSLSEIVAEIEESLERDDDVIQQWFGADEVLKLLRSAATFGEMLDRVECVCGGFETDERLRGIVVGVLGKEWLRSEET